MTDLRIDFVSDVACPWCAVGLGGLEIALERLAPDITVSLHLQPFELNPQMGLGGQDLGEHLAHKYGTNAEQQAEMRRTITERGAQVGFVFHPAGRGRVYNTFNCHRLLHWAETQDDDAQSHGHALALKKAFLRAYQGRAENMDDPAVLLACVREVGLDASDAQAVLTGQDFTDEVRERQAFFTQAGIRSVPAIIINRRHLISGGQPPEVFERALRDVANSAADSPSL
jgi:predicted DsbA family dithiol-disulfide isomerase